MMTIENLETMEKDGVGGLGSVYRGKQKTDDDDSDIPTMDSSVAKIRWHPVLRGGSKSESEDLTLNYVLC